MSNALDRCTAALGDKNVRAFLHVIGAGESGEQLTELDYRVINGGTHFDAPPWAHPYYGIPTTRGGRASGAFQFLGTTFQRCDEALGLNGDFSPASQDVGAVFLMAGRGALSAVMRGDLETACHKLAEEWVSLPGMGMTRIRSIFQTHGGTLAAQDGAGATISPEPIHTPPGAVTSAPAAQQQPEKPMPVLALLQLFGPALAGLIPQIASFLKPQSEVAQRNVGIAQVLVDTIVKTAGAANLQGAVEAMQADPKVKQAVQEAVVTHPDIIGVLEIGGGIKAARDASVVMQNAERPFWYNPMFWVTAAFFPMMYVIIGAVLFTVDATSPSTPDAPFWRVVGFDQATRSGLVNLIVGMVFGGVVGVWFGTSYGSQRKTELTAIAKET